MNQKGKSKYTFLKNEKLTEEGKSACKVLHIDPSMLAPKTKDHFKQGGVSEDIANIRFDHYEEKRKALLDEIDDYLRGANLRNTTMSFTRR